VKNSSNSRFSFEWYYFNCILSYMMICNVINSLMGLLVMGLYVGVLFLNSRHCICPSCINTECIKLFEFTLRKGRETRSVGLIARLLNTVQLFATPSSTGISYPHHWKEPANEESLVVLWVP
jgi:hypothetical protein